MSIQLTDHDAYEADDYAGCLFLDLSTCPIEPDQYRVPPPPRPEWKSFFLEKPGDSSGELLLSYQVGPLVPVPVYKDVRSAGPGSTVGFLFRGGVTQDVRDGVIAGRHVDSTEAGSLRAPLSREGGDSVRSPWCTDLSVFISSTRLGNWRWLFEMSTECRPPYDVSHVASEVINRAI